MQTWGGQAPGLGDDLVLCGALALRLKKKKRWPLADAGSSYLRLSFSIKQLRHPLTLMNS